LLAAATAARHAISIHRAYVRQPNRKRSPLTRAESMRAIRRGAELLQQRRAADHRGVGGPKFVFVAGCNPPSQICV